MTELCIPRLIPEGWQFHCPPPPGFKQPWLSSNDRKHWSQTFKLVAAWRDQGRQAGSGLPQHEKPYVLAELAFGDNRRRDDHNFMPTVKAIVDGLTDAHVWLDDNSSILIGPDLRRNEKLPRGVTMNLFERLF